MDTAGFRLVCETAVAKFGPELAQFVLDEAVTAVGREQSRRLAADKRAEQPWDEPKLAYMRQRYEESRAA